MKPFEQCCRDLLSGDATEHDRCRVAIAAERLYVSVENMMPYVLSSYRSLSDDGVEQDAVMTCVIEPARAALKKAEGAE